MTRALADFQTVIRSPFRRAHRRASISIRSLTRIVRPRVREARVLLVRGLVEFSVRAADSIKRFRRYRADHLVRGAFKLLAGFAGRGWNRDDQSRRFLLPESCKCGLHRRAGGKTVVDDDYGSISDGG